MSFMVMKSVIDLNRFNNNVPTPIDEANQINTTAMIINFFFMT